MYFIIIIIAIIVKSSVFAWCFFMLLYFGMQKIEVINVPFIQIYELSVMSLTWNWSSKAIFFPPWMIYKNFTPHMLGNKSALWSFSKYTRN